MLPDMWSVAKPLKVEYRQAVLQSSFITVLYRKMIEKQPCDEKIEGQESRSRRYH